MAVYDKFGSVRIPKGFFDDHADRGLPAPTIERTTAGHYWIDQADPNLSELKDDASYYARDVDACSPGLVLSARALLKALGEDA